MGLFKHKKQVSQQPDEEGVSEAERSFFDDYFREELRNHGRWHFEKILKENGELFKQDLTQTLEYIKADLNQHITTKIDEAIADINTEMKTQLTAQLNEHAAGYAKAVQDAQNVALRSVTESVQSVEHDFKQLSDSLHQSAAEQAAKANELYNETRAQIEAMKDAQSATLQWLNNNAQALHEQYVKLSETLQQDVKNQETMLVSAFEDQMVTIIEHYLLQAMSDQFDIKAQIPSIIKQMEANKQAIADDVRL